MTRADGGGFPSAPGSRPSPRTALAGLFRDKWKIAAAAALTLAAAAALCLRLAPEYVASASLYVKFGREYTYRAETGGSEVMAQGFDRDRVLNSEVRLLLAPDLADEVVGRLGVARLYPDIAAGPPAGVAARDAARVAFRAALDAAAGADSHVIGVTFRHPDARTATEALDALLDAYLARRRPLFAEVRADALEREAARARRRLELADDAAARFRLARGIVDFAGQRGLLLEQGAALDRDLQAAGNDLAASGERVARLRASLERLPPTVVLHAERQRNPALDEATKALLGLRLRETELTAEYFDQSRPVRDVRRGIGLVEELLGGLEPRPESTVRTGPNPVHDALAGRLAEAEADAGATAARREAAGRQLAGARARLDALAAEERELDALMRERESALANHANLARKLDETRVLDELASSDSANVRIFQPARTPPRPEDPRPLVLAAGLVAATLAGLLAAFLCDLLRSGYITPEQLERSTGLPVLASVPLRLRHRPAVLRLW